jgi:MFS family permease
MIPGISSRNVPILAIASALNMSGATMMALLGGLVGKQLASDPSLATLPASLSVVGLAAAVVPANMLAQKIGRKRLFQVSAVGAGLAALLAAWAVYTGDFVLFSVSAVLIGLNNAVGQQYRFAAAEAGPASEAGRAVSIVLLGGILAGYFGPEIARRTSHLIPQSVYVGSFMSLALLYWLGAGVVSGTRTNQAGASAAAGPVGGQRSLQMIALQPLFMTAVLSVVVAAGVMTLVMTAAPLHLEEHAFSLDDITLVIQAHIVAMFLPSLISGWLIDRLGVVRLMLLGVLALAGTVAIGLVSQSLLQYWWALVLLGVGWNFLFVGGTVLLMRAYTPAERFKAQGLNDFILFGAQALTTFSAGTMISLSSWETLLLVNVPVLALTLAVLLALRRGLVTAG